MDYARIDYAAPIHFQRFLFIHLFLSSPFLFVFLFTFQTERDFRASHFCLGCCRWLRQLEQMEQPVTSAVTSRAAVTTLASLVDLISTQINKQSLIQAKPRLYLKLVPPPASPFPPPPHQHDVII